MRQLRLLLFTFALLLAGCSSPAAAEPVTLTLEMSEYVFTPELLVVKVGQQVTINLVNRGELPHEVMFGREVMVMSGLPSGYMEDLFQVGRVMPSLSAAEGKDVHLDNPQSHGHNGYMVLLPAEGDQASLTFTVTKEMVGEWEMGCFEQDGVHYTAGMKGRLVVEE